MALNFYTSVAKRLTLHVRKFCGLIPTFVEVTREKLVGGGGAFCSPILNRVKQIYANGLTSIRTEIILNRG